MGTYWGSEWIAYNSGAKIIIQSGKYPSSNKDEKTLKTIKKEELSFSPTIASANQEQRIIAFANSGNYYTFDMENKTSSSFATDSDISDINWLDNFLIWQKHEDKLVERDFNGSNRRELVQDLNNDFPAVITANNKYLYYFDRVEQETVVATTGEEVAPTEEVPATEEIATEPTVLVTYTLTRELLQ